MVSIFASLVRENIFSFQIQACGCSVDALQIARMDFPAGPIPKMEPKDMLNDSRARKFGAGQMLNLCQEVRRECDESLPFHTSYG